MFNINQLKQPTLDASTAFQEAYPNYNKLRAYYKDFQPWLEFVTSQTYIEGHLKQFAQSMGIFEICPPNNSTKIQQIKNYQRGLQEALAEGVSFSEESTKLFKEILASGYLEEQITKLEKEQKEYEDYQERLKGTKYLLKKVNKSENIFSEIQP